MEHASPRGSPSIYDDGGYDADDADYVGNGNRSGNGKGKIAAVDGLVSQEWRRLGMGLVRDLEVERERVRKGAWEDAGRWGSASVESWAPRRVNPEVEMYVRA